ncbi:hypothetical protein JB92DRAFT_3029571 [Gautieria morchelliformis]|nr:hypothetical protein JB92DRAFT_3029571 [Gautieria morchelliformis]
MPHSTKKVQCTCGFCCSRSHSASAHVWDFRDTAMHNAGSQDAPTHLNSTHAVKCMTHRLTAAVKTEASQSMPSLPGLTSSHALASSICVTTVHFRPSVPQHFPPLQYFRHSAHCSIPLFFQLYYSDPPDLLHRSSRPYIRSPL